VGFGVAKATAVGVEADFVGLGVEVTKTGRGTSGSGSKLTKFSAAYRPPTITTSKLATIRPIRKNLSGFFWFIVFYPVGG
jgi:hypothetical protein